MCLQRSVTFVEEVLQNIDLARDRQRSRVSVPGKSQTARKPSVRLAESQGRLDSSKREVVMVRAEPKLRWRGLYGVS